MDLNIYEVVRAGISSVTGLREFQVRSMGAEGNDPSAAVIDSVQSVEPLGVSSNPAAKRSLRTLAYQLGKQLVSIAAWDKGARPAGLAVGEIRFHALRVLTACLRYLDDGSGFLTSDYANGKDMVVNGGSAKVAREGDSVDGGTITATVATAPGPVTFIYTPAGGGTPVTSTTLTLSGGKITAGAANFKA